MSSRGWRSLAAPGAGVVAAVLALTACSLGTEVGDKPETARVRVEGTSPHPLTLVISTDFYEQFDPLTGVTTPVYNTADTEEITLPFDRTFDLDGTGSVYVELRNALVPAADVRLRVDLDGGQKYDQEATLSDNGALVYYYIYQFFR